ncbi:hypothetical protein [Thermobacillus sp.]|uniref:hypothetical protein n=1 Tax=Thermobacillus sp. TaxID=2108467 RepID=UPI00257E26F3|nr:hypothetical protein [Thermobacillus sp.]
MIIAAAAMKKNAAGTMVFAAAAEPQACPIYYIAIYRARDVIILFDFNFMIMMTDKSEKAAAVR